MNPFEKYDRAMEIEKKRIKKKEEGKQDLGDVISKNVTPPETAEKLEKEEEFRKNRFRSMFKRSRD